MESLIKSGVIKDGLTILANEKGYKMQELAKACEIPMESVSSWLKKKTAPTEEEFAKICNVLNCNIEGIIKAGGGKERAEAILAASSAPIKKAVEPKKIKKSKKPTKESKTMDNITSVVNEEQIINDPALTDTVHFENTVAAIPVTTPDNVSEKIVGVPLSDVKAQPKVGTKAKSSKSETKQAKKTESKWCDASDEEFIRNTLKLKKSEPVTKGHLTTIYCNEVREIVSALNSLGRITNIVEKLLAEEPTETDESVKKLTEAAKKAPAEAIDIAVKILENYKNY